MEASQTEVLGCDSDAADVPAEGAITSMVSSKTEAFECNQYVGSVDKVGGMHDGINIDSVGMELLESAGGNKKTMPDGIASGDNDESRRDASMPVSTVVVLDESETFMSSRCPVESVDVRTAATESDGVVRASAKTEDDSSVFPPEQGIVTSLLKAPEIEGEATVPSLKDNKGHGTVPVSNTCANLTATDSTISNQEQSFGVAATHKSEGSKFVDATFHHLEENQIAEHAYDMDFDIEAHEMPLEESFFDGSCMFPALETDKTEWHAGVEDVTMEEGSPQSHNQHSQDVNINPFPEETKNGPVTMHDVKENMASSEERLYNSQQQPGCETVVVDAPHGVEDLSSCRVQGHEELAGCPCIETGGETLVSTAILGKELHDNHYEDEDARKIQVECDTDASFANLAGENVETAHDARTCETKRLEEEVNTKIIVKNNEPEPISIDVTHEDASAHLHELDDDILEGPLVYNSATGEFNPTVIELRMKVEDLSEDSSCIGRKEKVTQIEVQGKVTSQSSGCSDFGKKEDYFDKKSNEASAADKLVDTKNALVIDSSGVFCTDSPALIQSGNTKPEQVLLSSEQGVIFCKEITMEAVSQPLAQEEASKLEQNAIHDKLAVNNSESHYRHEVDTMDMEEAAHSQTNEPVVMDGNFVVGLDDGLLATKNEDLQERNESGNETVDVRKIAEEQAKVSSDEHQQSDHKVVDNFDAGAPERGNFGFQKIYTCGDETEEGNVVEHEENQISEELKQSDGGSIDAGKIAEQEANAANYARQQNDKKVVDKFDFGVPEPDNFELKEIFKSGDEIEDGKPAEHDKIQINEELDQSDGGSMDVGKIAEQEAKAVNDEHRQSGQKVLDDFDVGMSEPSNFELKEIYPSGGKIEEGKVAEHGTSIINQKLNQSDGGSMDGFDGIVAEMAEGRVAELQQQKEAPDEGSENHYAMPMGLHFSAKGKNAGHDGGSVDVLDGTVMEMRESGLDEILDSVEGSIVAVPQQEIEEPDKEPENHLASGNLSPHSESAGSDGVSMGVIEGSVRGMKETDVNEILDSGDAIIEGSVVIPQQEEAPDKGLENHFAMPIGGDSCVQGESAGSDGGPMDIYNCSMVEMKESDMDAILDSGDRSIESRVEVLQEETEAPDKGPENQSAVLMVGALSPRAEAAYESVSSAEAFIPPPRVSDLDINVSSAEALFYLPRASDPENNVSFGTDCDEKMRVSDLLKDSNSVEQSASPLEQRKGGRVASPVAPSNNKSKKVVSDDKLSKAEVSNKLNLSVAKEAKEGVHVGDDVNTKCRSEQEESASDEKVRKSIKEELVFGIGDLVWAKVRSHPWWPAQIFDPADASKPARRAKKSGRVLVAFFGDCTFAWLQQSQMIAFRSNFKEKVQQTTLRVFCLAVEEALEELCRRSELGLSCKHFTGSLHSSSSFPDSNTGIREGVRAKRLKDIHTSADMFRPRKTLEFVRSVAASPLGVWSSTLHWAESRGHAYALRTCMVAMQGMDSAPVLLTPPAVPSQGLKLKRRHSALNADGGKKSKKSKKLKSDKGVKDFEGKDLLAEAVSGEENKQVSMGNDAQVKSGMKDLMDARERNKGRTIIKIKLSKNLNIDHLSTSERRSDIPSSEGTGGERNLDDSKEKLLAVAGHSVKGLKRLSSREGKHGSSSKKVLRLSGEKSQIETSKHCRNVEAILTEGFSDMDADALLRSGRDTKEDAFNVLPSPSRDRVKKMEGSKMSVEIGLRKEALVKDNNVGKNESLRKFSKVGDSIKRVASELKGTPAAKVVDVVRRTESEEKNDRKELSLERQASPVHNESLEDVSLLQLRRDLELFAKKTGSGGAKGNRSKQSKKGDQGETVAEKSSPQWQSVPQRSQRSCVQELALAARKRKSEIVHDEVFVKVPKNSSTASSQRYHTSKGYITSAEKPVERRSYDKSLLLNPRRPAPPASSMKSSSSHRYDEKLSSHAPLGLFMRFPEDFPLPSEAQLKAIFIPFGPLQMSATRLYKDSASAQVVFKHGRDAESALKHAKKNPMFGQVAVTYRLRHLSHSTRVEAKTDTPSIKAHSSQVAALRESASLRAGSSALLDKRAGDKKVGSSIMRSSSSHDDQFEREPTGDIQDQMLTLLRQVSVIVKTSPVTSDGT